MVKVESMKAGIFVATFVAALTGIAVAQAPNARDISGYWELTYMFAGNTEYWRK